MREHHRRTNWIHAKRRGQQDLPHDINRSAASAAGGGMAAAAVASSWMSSASCWAAAPSIVLHCDRVATIVGSLGKPDGFACLKGGKA